MSGDNRPGRAAELGVIIRAWEAALAIPVNADDDFFAAGGDSLMAIDVADSLRTLLDVPLESIDLFDHPTPNSLAGYVVKLHENEL